MSKLRFDRKPPLPKSPIRRRNLRSNSTVALQTPPGSLMKSMKRVENTPIGSEYESISLGLTESYTEGDDGDWLFVRGRFYDEYTARRNERLKRKKMGESSDYGEEGRRMNSPSLLGVKTESAAISKKRQTNKKPVHVHVPIKNLESELAPRYLLRSSVKVNQKSTPSVDDRERFGFVSDRKPKAKAKAKAGGATTRVKKYY